MFSFLHIDDEQILQTRINNFINLHIFRSNSQKLVCIEQIRISFYLGEPIYGNKQIIKYHSISS